MSVGACDGAEEIETCAARIFQERIQRKNLLEMFGDDHLIKWLLSSVIQNEQRTFTLPNNIITDFSLARVLCDLDCMMNKSLTP